MLDVLEITLHLASTLEDLRVPYLVGGSIASSLHGIPRATLDADILASPEDIVVQKLYWNRLGGHVSDRQWNDALGVIKVQKDRLDEAYMQRIARELEVEDLLEQSLKHSSQRRA